MRISSQYLTQNCFVKFKLVNVKMETNYNYFKIFYSNLQNLLFRLKQLPFCQICCH